MGSQHPNRSAVAGEHHITALQFTATDDALGYLLQPPDDLGSAFPTGHGCLRITGEPAVEGLTVSRVRLRSAAHLEIASKDLMSSGNHGQRNAIAGQSPGLFIGRSCHDGCLLRPQRH